MCLCPPDLLSSARGDAAAPRRVGQPAQRAAADGVRRQGELRPRPADAAVPWRERGRGVLPGRGPPGPHPGPAEAPHPAERPGRPGAVMSSALISHSADRSNNQFFFLFGSICSIDSMFYAVTLHKGAV